MDFTGPDACEPYHQTVVSRSGTRAWLAAAVAAAILSGLALVSIPRGEPVPAPAGGPGQPMGAISPAPPPVNQADSERAGAITELLRRRADALLRRDEQVFLATVDPKADPAFLTAQREMFANLAGVPLDEWAYQVRAEDTLETSGLPASTTDAAEEMWAPAVDLRYRLRGVDLIPTTRPMGYLFARHADSWYLHSDTALTDLGRRTWRGPWDFGPCLVTATANGIVLAHPGSESMVDRLVRELDSSVRAVTSVWGTQWSQRVALMLPDSPAEMRALVGPDFPVDAVVAVAVADRVDIARHTVAGQRVVLSPSGSRALSIASLRVVLRHEITHVAARAETVDGSPMWLLEGFADYVGYRDSGVALAQGAPDLTKLVRASGPPASLPEDRDFRARGRELDLAYQGAWSIARFVADRYGEDKLVALYRTVAGAGPVSAGETDDLMRQGLGVDRAGLVAGWQQYLRDTLK